jgi:ATPase subunit of ABC transporter with duplicated ATPase domains
MWYQQMEGTLVVASHDTNFIRQITDGECFVLVGGHLRRITVYL